MTHIPVDRFRAQPGRMRARLFQDPQLGPGPALYYDITIPLEPFDSGLDWEEQPVRTEFSLEFLKLPVEDWRDLHERSFELAQDEADASIYLGGAHNPVEVRRIHFTRVGETALQIDCTLFCDFEAEMVAESLALELTTEVEFEGLVVDGTGRAGDSTQRDGA